MGLIGGMARTAVVAGTATAVEQPRLAPPGQPLGAERSVGLRRPQYAQPQYAQPVYAAAAAVRPAPVRAAASRRAAPAPAASGTDDMLNQLRQLAQLKDQGILTEAEFVAQKARILGA